MNTDVLKVFVYGLVELGADRVFYVGITANPSERMVSHRNAGTSNASFHVREIEDAGGKCEMRILAGFPTRQAALDYEHHLIETMPDLVNLDRTRYTIRNGYVTEMNSEAAA